jgi:hypothetical protein
MFWFFDDAFCFVGFLTQIFYILTPIALMIQLKNNVLKPERVSIFGLSCLYGNAFIYFWTSAYKAPSGQDINPLDFCNLAGFYLGFIYLMIYIYFIHFKFKKLYGILLASGLVIISLVFWLIIKFTVKRDNVADKTFNWIGVVLNVCEYFPLGFSIIYLLKNKISEKYTLFGAFFGFLNCVAWLAWAIYAVVVNHNKLEHSIAANCFGICLTVGQVVLFFVFRRGDSEETGNIEDKTNDIVEGGIDVDNTKEETKDPEYIQDYM